MLALNPKEFASKAAYETAIIDALHECDVKWIVLAGYMRLISDVLLAAFPQRIVNIHPSLLPAFHKEGRHWSSNQSWCKDYRGNSAFC